MNRNAKIPKSFKEYFWDVKFEDLDLKKSRTFILKRVLDRGDTKALGWIRRNYTNRDIEKLLLTTRDVSPKTANFWALLLGIDRKKVVCLQKPYSRIQFGLSS